jgi:hypothetical protein
MNIHRSRESRHGLLAAAALALPMLALLGCESASSGHAPGLAGGQTLTPGITNYPLAYIKEPAPAPTSTSNPNTKTDIDARDLITSITGSDLYVRDSASAAGIETNVTQSITMGNGAVRDLDVSPDGSKIVFSLRLPLNPKLKNTDPKQPHWKIYEYDANAKTVTQLTTDDITSGHDVGAHYLPDGRIVFASTRQLATQSILLDEGRPQYQAVTDDRRQFIFLLHVMNADGSNMHQISFNTNHDFAPSVLSNGQIVFSRWESTNGGQISLYRANPDGSGLELLYGAQSHATGANVAGTNNNVIQFLNARQRADGKVLAIARPFLGTQLGGDLLLVDANGYVEIAQPSAPGGGTGPGQASATTLGVTTDANMPSPGGRFASVYPLYDGTNRALVSWSPCLLLNASVSPATTTVCSSSNMTGANVQVASPQYTLWVYDFNAGTLSPLLSAGAGTVVVEPVILQKRVPLPPYIPDFTPTTTAQQAMVTASVGVLDISSVYDFDGVDTAKPSIAMQANPGQAGFYTRPARFIRIEKAVEIPDKTVRKINASAFGPAGMGMREILGYAPIQPDGSVRVEVPANVPFTIDILDANARRITAQHTSWLQVMPGEIKSCNGCHTTVNKTSHGRSGLTLPVNPGAPTTGQPFPSTNPALFANAGETMAQTLARVSCVKGSAIPCSQTLSSDVIYAGVWTAGTTPPQADTAFSYTYGGAMGIPGSPPTNASCAPWSAQCRITIHYANANSNPPQLYIQNLWNLPSRTATVNGVANTSVTCTLCHNTVNAQNAVQVPTGQLDLTGGASSVDPSVVTSYEQVLFPHDEQTLNMGVLQTLTVVVNPGPPPVTMPVQLAAPMAAGSAGVSTAFLRMFDGSYHDPVLDHTGYLTPGELRLISEWLDIGAQFYNDPFVAPVAN